MKNRALIDPFDVITFEEDGYPRDIKGLPMPLSDARELRDKLIAAIDSRTPDSLARETNWRLGHFGPSYLEQFAVEPEDMA